VTEAVEREAEDREAEDREAEEPQAEPTVEPQADVEESPEEEPAVLEPEPPEPEVPEVLESELQEPESAEPDAAEPETRKQGAQEPEVQESEAEAPALGTLPDFPRLDADPAAAGDAVFGFNLAKVEGAGEDSDPIVYVSRDLIVVGVFDGMGGAGGTVYETETGPHSGAYIASRLVRDLVERRLVELVREDWELDGPAVAAQLQTDIQNELVGALAALHAPRSGLRSKLLRALPTTMAVAALQRREPAGNDWTCSVFWAGDSRVYLLEPEDGIAQLTVDDIRDRGDAMANLREDSVMSNAISADTRFMIHHQQFNLTAPFLMIAATDGCFGYVPSPMHFEYLILSALRDSADTAHWSAEISARIAAVTGDDAAMGVVGVGADRAALRSILDRRTNTLENHWIRPLDILAADRNRLQLELELLQTQTADLESELWTEYKAGYERFHGSAGDIAAGQEPR
jgi:serine/threonine protein phosphatase PrpC